MDWITLLIEIVGFVILMMWIVIPIREFRGILRKLKTRAVSLVEPPGHGFEVNRVRDPEEPHA